MRSKWWVIVLVCLCVCQPAFALQNTPEKAMVRKNVYEGCVEGGMNTEKNSPRVKKYCGCFADRYSSQLTVGQYRQINLTGDIRESKGLIQKSADFCIRQMSN